MHLVCCRQATSMASGVEGLCWVRVMDFVGVQEFEVGGWRVEKKIFLL